MKINSQSMKILNERLILRTIIENENLTRIELSRMTKLTPSTVSRIVSDLVEMDFIEESGQVQMSSVGRRATKLSTTRKFCPSVVFNVGVEQTEAAVGYLDKSVENLREFPTGSLSDFTKRVNETVEKIEKKFPIDRKRTFVTFAFPGIVDTKISRVVYSPNLNWRNVDLPEILPDGYPILADNEANLSILAESAFSEDVKNSDNAFFLYISQGIGGGAMINQKILRGKGFAGAEIGHTVVEARSDIKCHCGNYGCFERFASLILPVIEYEKNGRKLPGKTRKEKFDSLIELYESKDQGAADALKSFKHYLAIGISNIVNTFNPEVIVIGGDNHSLWKHFGDEIVEKISSRVMPETIEGVIFRDTLFKKSLASIVGGNILAIDRIINTLEI